MIGREYYHVFTTVEDLPWAGDGVNARELTLLKVLLVVEQILGGGSIDVES